MRYRWIAAVAAGSLAATLAFAVAASEAESSPDPEASMTPGSDPAPVVDTSAVEWLYIQYGGAGTLESTGDGMYGLTLNDVEPSTLAFSDTPDRLVQVLPTADVVSAIVAAENKPNAALQITAPAYATVVLTLTDGTYDEDEGTLTYTAQLVTDDPTGEPILLDELPDGTFTAPILFIDDETTGSTSSKASSSASVAPSPPPGFQLPVEVGSTCKKVDDTNAKGSTSCWWLRKGGENWPPMYSALKVTFKNTGELRSYVQHCFTYNLHHLEPGDTVELTFKQKTTFVCAGWQKKDASKDGLEMKIEIAAIKNEE